MSVGTAIFLSAVLLGFVALFIATRDRWNWKKIIPWPLAVIVAIAALYAYTLMPETSKAESSFGKISLGATKADVKFIRGEPTEKTPDFWTYLEKDPLAKWRGYYVSFINDKVWSVVYSGGAFDWHESIQGVTLGHDVDKVREKFGEPSHIAVSKDGLKRVYSYNKYNVLFEMEKNKITALGIYNPAIAKRGVTFPMDQTDPTNNNRTK